MLNSRLLRAILLVVSLALLMPQVKAGALGGGQYYANPIAFVRGSAIVVTSPQGEEPVPIIFPDKTSKASFNYSRPQWSPDGNQLITSEYSQQTDGTSSMQLIGIVSGDRPAPFLTIEPFQRMLTTPIVWTNGGNKIAYFDGAKLFLVPSKGGTAKLLYAPNIAYAIGEGGSLDPAEALSSIEQDNNLVSNSFHLINTAFGLLIGADLQTADGGVDSWGLVSPDGKLVWSANFSTAPIVSPDGKQAIAGYGGYLKGADTQSDLKPIVLVDLSTGEVSPLKLQPGGIPLGWDTNGKAVFIGTQKKIAELTGGDSSVGLALFPDTWPFVSVENMLTLWWASIDPSDTTRPLKLWEGKGYSFGVMTVGNAQNLPIVFSVVPSSVPMLDAINKGATQQAAQKLMPAVEIYAIDLRDSRMLWNMPGGRPSYGTGKFGVIVSTP